MQEGDTTDALDTVSTKSRGSPGRVEFHARSIEHADQLNGHTIAHMCSDNKNGGIGPLSKQVGCQTSVARSSMKSGFSKCLTNLLSPLQE